MSYNIIFHISPDDIPDEMNNMQQKKSSVEIVSNTTTDLISTIQDLHEDIGEIIILNDNGLHIGMTSNSSDSLNFTLPDNVTMDVDDNNIPIDTTIDNTNESDNKIIPLNERMDSFDIIEVQSVLQDGVYNFKIQEDSNNEVISQVDGLKTSIVGTIEDTK
jgi:hypothetical protein